LLSDKLTSDDAEAQIYADIIDSIHSVHANINTEYVINTLDLFAGRKY
jgi:hypothetical protein